jgi:hypothetical protein
MSALPKPQQELLKATSRSFYLRLQIVPQGQPEISQPQGGWNTRPKTCRVLKGRWK